MRALCVARHPILSEHLSRFFERFDVAASPIVGMRQARSAALAYDPDVVFCDYDLLTPTQLELWRADPVCRSVPIVAVSMRKRPDEVAAVDRRGVVAFLYLPAVDPDALRPLFAALRRSRDSVASPGLSWPRTAAAVRQR